VTQPDATESDYRAYAQAGVAALQRWYRPWTGLWRTTGWWNGANALTAVMDYTERTGDQTHARAADRTFRRARRRNANFVNKFFDDNGWWALAWIKAYDNSRDDRYLHAAQFIFSNMITGWDEICGGGVWWNTDRNYKNAITNELFLTLAARLHQRAPGDGSYLDWALREWDWFGSSGMISATGLVNDGLTADCKNNGKPAYTYNQGVILGGLGALYEITGDGAYLRQGEAIADAALRHLTTPAEASPAGILIEPGEAGMMRRRADGSQFKGIFVRNLHDFYRLSGRPAYREFILRNARSIWVSNRNDRNQFGLYWAGPFDSADASRQSSALEALTAAVALAG
jgi:predicted alpha-1,6-mannanase (GH76 family)